MRTREEIFEEVSNRYENGETCILVHLGSSTEFTIWLNPSDAIIRASVYDLQTYEEAARIKVAKTGDFEEDLYNLIDLLIEEVL